MVDRVGDEFAEVRVRDAAVEVLQSIMARPAVL